MPKNSELDEANIVERLVYDKILNKEEEAEQNA